MNDVFRIRGSTPNDAEGILRAHYSAVHQTAKKDYSDVILNLRSRPVDAQRIAAYRAKMETDKSVISFVAVDDFGEVLGFGELVPPKRWGRFMSPRRLAGMESQAHSTRGSKLRPAFWE